MEGTRALGPPDGVGSRAAAAPTAAEDFGDDGFDPADCTKDEKIAHLWQLYLQTETDLNAALKNAELQRQQHADEMHEVEAYVAHIRALSDEREALTVELEAENERLRKLAETPPDVALLLEQQGFDSSVGAMSMAELVVYLLLERSRLMTELEEERNRQEGQCDAMMEEVFKQKIAQMALDFDEEREGLSKQMSEFLEEHISEMDQLVQEKELAERKLTEANRRIDQLINELTKYGGGCEEDDGIEGRGRPSTAPSGERRGGNDESGSDNSVSPSQLRHALVEASEENSKLEEQLTAVMDELVEKQSECSALRAEVERLSAPSATTTGVLDENVSTWQHRQRLHSTGSSSLAGGADNEFAGELATMKETLSEKEDELQVATFRLQESLERAEKRDKQLSLATAEIKSLKEQVLHIREEKALLERENAALRESRLETRSVADSLSRTGQRPGSADSQFTGAWSASLTSEPNASAAEHDEIAFQQLEAANKDLNKKLHEAYFRCEQAERQLRKEKLKCKELSSKSSAEVDRQVKAYFCNIEDEISQLRQRTLPSRMTEMNAPDLLSLKLEMVHIRLQHQKEIDDVVLKLQQAELEANMLRESLSARQEELQVLRSGDSKLQTSLATEVRMRKQAEEWNRHLQTEATKLWDKVRDLSEQKTRLDAENGTLREKLDQYQTVMHNENFLNCSRETDSSKSLELARARVAKAEHEIALLRANLETVKASQSESEKQLEELTAVKEKLGAHTLKVKQLKNQLHEEQRHRMAEANLCDDLRRQLSATRDKESRLREQLRELQHTLIDAEAKVNSAQEETKSCQEMLDECQRSKRSLALRAEVRAQEVETLQLELLVANERLQIQLDKYAERRERHREKLLRARDIFNSVKFRLKEKIAMLEAELRLTRVSMRSGEG